jgi:hypothetical protein
MTFCHRLDLNVYDITGTTLQATLPASGVAFSKGLGGGGFLSASIDARLPALVADPTMLDDCVIKVAVPLTDGGAATEILAYANRARNGTLHSGAGEQTREIRQAPTIFTAWMQDAILHTEANDIAQFAAPLDGKRYFGYQSTIYNPATTDSALWGTPSTATGKQNATGGDRAGNPDGWPTELGDAYWITRGATNNGNRHLFIKDVVVPTSCYLTVYFSADETCSVWFAGQRIVDTSSSETGYQQISTWSGWVTSGTYRLAVSKLTVVSRGGDGVDPILCAVASNTDNGGIQDILVVTNATWKVHTMDPITGEAPSLTPGQIVLELLEQAQDRGVTTLATVTTDVTATADSASAAWPQREERAWRLGYDSMFDMMESLGDLPFAPDLTPARVLKVWGNKGTDRSASVVIEALVGADSITEQGVGVAATYLPVETDDGWVTVENAGAQATYGRREQALSLGNAPSTAQGKRLGQKVLDTRLAIPTSEWSVDFYATATTVPFYSFVEGDTVMVRYGGVSYPRVVLDIGASAEHTEAIIRWTIKTGLPEGT